MGYPRGAPIKPKKFNRMAHFGMSTGMLFIGAGIYVMQDYYSNSTSKVIELSRALVLQERPMLASTGHDINKIKEQVKILDEKAKYDLMPGGSYVTAAQLREAKYKYDDAQLSNEVRDFFFKKSENENDNENENENENDITNIKKVEPGVYGSVIVTRLPKENETEENETKETTQ